MFRPFRGLLFDPAAVGDVGAATSPPYDVIDDDHRRRLESASPHNIVRLLLGGPDDPTYAGAARMLASWRSAGVLVPDAEERFYLYTMTYDDPTGRRRTAAGLLGALELLPLGDRVVPHEETMAKHRADRLAVLTATQANLDVIIGLSASPDLAPLIEPRGEARLDFEVEGVEHRLYDVADAVRIAAIEEAVEGHAVSIADGHHRYTTALGYRETRDAADGEGPWGQILAFVAPAEGSGLTIGPYHRAFKEFPFRAEAVTDAFDAAPCDPGVRLGAGELAVVTPTGSWHLVPLPEALDPLPEPWREASPAVARELLYPRLGITEDHAAYLADAASVQAAVSAGRFAAGLLVAPVTEHAIAAAGEANLRFPQKTTFFVPKPRAGLVVRSFDV